MTGTVHIAYDAHMDCAVLNACIDQVRRGAVVTGLIVMCRKARRCFPQMRKAPNGAFERRRQEQAI